MLEGSIPTELGLIPGLKALCLPSNKLTGVIPIQLANLFYLQKLDISYNNISGQATDNFTKLIEFYYCDLTCTQITCSWAVQGICRCQNTKAAANCSLPIPGPSPTSSPSITPYTPIKYPIESSPSLTPDYDFADVWITHRGEVKHISEIESVEA